MKREVAIAIIMEAGSTKREAEKHLKEGTTIYSEDDYTEFCINCSCNGWSDNEIEELWESLYTVSYKGMTYRIDFVF